MTFTPPEGSRIAVLTKVIGEPIIVIPVAANTTRYLYVAFLLAWLVMWSAGGIEAGSRFLSGMSDASGDLGGTVFMGAWLVGWVVGVIFAVYFLYRSLRPSVPESLRLTRGGVDFESGIRPPRLSFQGRQRPSLSDIFPRRIRCQISPQQLKSLRQREFETGTRLTVDVGNRRFEIGREATDVEREWLFGLLVDRYRLHS
ncbi:MAG: hypothetical protein FWD68_01640 [Alphaproteobacteria bacterium]|nr:hypothetical protein [Alphaproteobacteria bacterium]